MDSLEDTLKKEFKMMISSAQIHIQLFKYKRKHKKQYVYAMMEMASESSVEESALIEYIDGI